MTAPLRPGDRVRTKGYSRGGFDLEGFKCTVRSIDPDGEVTVKDSTGEHFRVKPSQCRRLRKVKRDPILNPRHIWIKEDDLIRLFWTHGRTKELPVSHHRESDEEIEFREVKPAEWGSKE